MLCRSLELSLRCTSLRLGDVERYVLDSYQIIRVELHPILFQVPSPWRIPASCLCTYCTCTISFGKRYGLIPSPGRFSWSFYSCAIRNPDFSAYCSQQSWGRRRHCIRSISSVHFRYDLGPYSVGVPRRVISSSSAAQVNCPRKRNKYQCCFSISK